MYHSDVVEDRARGSVSQSVTGMDPLWKESLFSDSESAGSFDTLVLDRCRVVVLMCRWGGGVRGGEGRGTFVEWLASDCAKFGVTN